MNAFHLGRFLGDVKPTAFKRFYLHQQLGALDHNTKITFDHRPKPDQYDSPFDESAPVIAHKAGTNCLTVDQTQGRYLISAGADTFIRLWDLEDIHSQHSSDLAEPIRPVSSISRSTRGSHFNSITSLSIYPFDPTPTTLLSTAYDSSFLITQITPSSLVPFHKFPLDHTTYCHAVSPTADSAHLIAIGTSHPAPRLIDMRSALATHALPGHTGSIYSLAWHPNKSHILISSSTAGQILAFDIRRATPAFASFDVDDTLGLLDPSLPRTHLDYSHRAHSGPITGIIFNHSGDKLISASHDQRIRVWDINTGRNDLVHYGPRIRNTREGELKPVLAPLGTSGVKGGRELLFWPNDDGRGEIFVHEVREGRMVSVLKTKNVKQIIKPAKPKRGRGGRINTAISNASNAQRLTSGGRISTLAFRPVRSTEGLGGALEMYTGHGDGRICAWGTDLVEEQDEEIELAHEEDEHGQIEAVDEERPVMKSQEEIDADRRRKRKRDLIEGLVEGLTKKRVTFS